MAYYNYSRSRTQQINNHIIFKKWILKYKWNNNLTWNLNNNLTWNLNNNLTWNITLSYTVKNNLNQNFLQHFFVFEGAVLWFIMLFIWFIKIIKW